MKSITIIKFLFSLVLNVALYRDVQAQLALNVTFASEDSNEAPRQWNVDPVHSKVKFTVAHLVISEVDGSFDVYDGIIESAQEDFSDAKIAFSVDAASIDTGNEDRDEHLKSEDFFSVAKYPTLTFESTSFEKKQGNEYALKGNLTMRGVTKPVVFDVKYGGTAQDGYGNTKAGFKVTGTLDRYDYGLKWNSMTEAGGLTVGQEIDITLNLEFALAQ